MPNFEPRQYRNDGAAESFWEDHWILCYIIPSKIQLCLPAFQDFKSQSMWCHFFIIELMVSCPQRISFSSINGGVVVSKWGYLDYWRPIWRWKKCCGVSQLILVGQDVRIYSRFMMSKWVADTCGSWLMMMVCNMLWLVKIVTNGL